LLTESGDPEKALRGYGRAIRFAENADVDCPGLYLRIAPVLKRRADADGELANLRAAVDASPPPPQHGLASALGLLLETNGRRPQPR
jgi:hypothetical protein